MTSTIDLPVRLRDDGRTATWNPAITRAQHVFVHVKQPDGQVDIRQSINSGRVRVRAEEQIERIVVKD